MFHPELRPRVRLVYPYGTCTAVPVPYGLTGSNINRREIAGLVGIARWNNAIGVPLGRFRVGLVT